MGKMKEYLYSLVEKAREQYGSDTIEISDAPEVSYADNGVWVQAWVWVADE